MLRIIFCAISSFLLFSNSLSAQSLISYIKLNAIGKLKERIEQGASLDEKDEAGASILMWSVYKGDLSLTKWLFEKGCKTNLSGVIYTNPEKTSYYGSLTAIAAGENKVDQLNYLITYCKLDPNEKEYNPEEKNNSGWTPLIWAAYNGNTETVAYLLKIGAKPSIQSQSGKTALHYSLLNKKDSISSQLIYFSAQPDIPDTLGWTPLHYAARNNKIAFTEALINKGANLNNLTGKNWTPLMLAAYNNNFEICKYLIENGADKQIKNNIGETALDLSKKEKNIKISNLLITELPERLIESGDTITNLFSSEKRIVLPINHSAPIGLSFFSSNDKHLVSLSPADNVIKIWDCNTGNLLKTFQISKTNKAENTELSEEENKFSFLKQIIREVPNENKFSSLLDSILYLHFQKQSISVTHEGNYLLSDNNSFYILDSTVKIKYSFHKHRGRITGYDYSNDMLATSSGSEVINLWNIKTGKYINTLPWETARFSTLKFNPTGKNLLASDISLEKNEINLFSIDIENGFILKKRSFPGIAISPHIFFSSDGSKVVVKTYNVNTNVQNILLLNFPDLSIVKSIASPPGKNLHFKTKETFLAISRDSNFLLFSLQTGEMIDKKVLPHNTTDLSFDSKCNIFFANNIGGITVYDIKSKTLQKAYTDSSKRPITLLSISPKDNTISLIYPSNQIVLLSKKNYAIKSSIPESPAMFTGVSIGTTKIFLHSDNVKSYEWDLKNIEFRKFSLPDNGHKKFIVTNSDDTLFLSRFDKKKSISYIKTTSDPFPKDSFSLYVKTSLPENDSSEIVGFSSHVGLALVLNKSDSSILLQKTDPKTGASSSQFLGKWYDKDVSSYKFSNNNKYLTILHSIFPPVIYDLITGNSLQPLGSNYVEQMLEVNKQNIIEDKFALLCENKKPAIYTRNELETKKELRKKLEKECRIGVFTRKQNIIIAEGEENEYEIYDFLTGEILYKPEFIFYKSVKYSSDNSTLVFLTNTLDENGISSTEIIIYSLVKKKLINILKLPNANYDFDINKDGTKLAVLSSNTGVITEYLTNNKMIRRAFACSKSNSSFLKYSKDNDRIFFLSSEDGLTQVEENETQSSLTLLSSFNDLFCAVHSNGYFKASREIGSTAYFVDLNLNQITFKQLDIKYNRPDKVLEAIGSTDTALIRSYRQAYLKRIKKLGIDTSAFKEGFTIPEADFTNREQLAFEQSVRTIRVHINGNSTVNLDRFNIWVNEVPVYGQKGISLRRRLINKLDTTISITLSAGENQIETSVTDVNGIESYRQPLFVKYNPEKPVKSNTYFIGIGINRFADSKNNLSWSVKDIRDLSQHFASKGAIIDTLFDERVTQANILSLKQRLAGTTEEDKVIIAYSGHGLLSSDFDYYLSTHTVNFSKPEENGLPYEELESLLDGIRARKKLMLIDACHSGEVDKEEITRYETATDSLQIKGTRGGKPRLTSGSSLGMKNSFELMQELFVNVGRSTGATVISAAGGTQFAQERGDLKNGVFSFVLLELLKKNKTVSISDLKNTVLKLVPELTNGLQKPTFRSETQRFDWSL